MGDRQLAYKAEQDWILVSSNCAVLENVSKLEHMGTFTLLSHYRSIILIDTNLVNCTYCS